MPVGLRIICIGICDPANDAPHQGMAAIWLKKQGFDVFYLSYGNSLSGPLETPMGILPCSFVKAGGLIAIFTMILRLLKLRLQADKNTIFFIQGNPVTLPSYLTLAGIPRENIIYQTQDYLEPGLHPHWELFERKIAQKAGLVISNEINRAKHLFSHYKLKEMPLVIRTALPSDWPFPKRKQSLRDEMLEQIGLQDNPQRRIIMAGGAYYEKRCSVELLQALRSLPDDYVLVFTNTTAADHPGRLAVAEAGLEKRVVFYGRLSYMTLLEYMAACDIGVLLYPNDNKGNYYQCPGRLGEYMGCGLPMLASNFPVFEDTIAKNNIGALVNPYSAEEMTHAITILGEMAGDTCQRERIQNLAQTKYSYEEGGKRLLEYLNKLKKEN